MSPTNSPSSGRVEVLHNGTWGTICDNSWNVNDADVVCHQLGYNGALSAPGDAAFGLGTIQIWLDDLQCVGDETSISECSHRGWGVHSCRHSKDAGAVCHPLGKRLLWCMNSPLTNEWLTACVDFSMIKINGKPSRMNCNRTIGEPVEKEALYN